MMKILLGMLLSNLLLIGNSVASDITDNRPGAATVYVKNHQEYLKQPDKTFLHLYLRNCSCGEDGGKLNLTSSNKLQGKLCPCWVGVDEQPIQGNPIRFAYVLNSYGSSIKPAGFGIDQETSEPYLRVPSPELLEKILDFIGVGEYFEFVNGSKSLEIDEYLELLANKKIPIGKPNIATAQKSDSKAYQICLHDYFNHFLLWLAAPNTYREIIGQRVSMILSKLKQIEKTFTNDNIASWISLLKFCAAQKLDSASANLNNTFFHNLIENKTDEDEEIRTLIEWSLNLGLRSAGSGNVAFTPVNNEDFFNKWLVQYNDFVRNLIRDAQSLSRERFSQNYSNFLSTIKNFEAYKDFLKLKKQDPKEIDLVYSTFIEFYNLPKESLKLKPYYCVVEFRDIMLMKLKLLLS